MTTLKIKLIHPMAILPQYQSLGAACFDLHAIIPEGTRSFVSAASPLTVRTGLAFEVPQGHVMLIYSRSGDGFNRDVRLANCVGVIDSDYRGEVQVKLTADNTGYMEVVQGSRIAQAMIVPIPHVRMMLVDELSSTERGTGGFGSTGHK